MFVVGYQDIPEIETLLEAAHYESPRLRVEKFSPERTRQTIDNILMHPAAEGWVCYLNGEAIGCMGAIMCPNLTADSHFASELLLYVLPKHRGGRSALLLVKAFEQWAGPYDKRAGTAFGVDDKNVIKFYERLGYEQMAVGVMKRGQNNG